MLSVGLVAASFALRDPSPETPAEDVEGLRARVDTSSAERAAESFLDAWRKRSHAQAIALSVGEARRAAKARRDEDAALDGDDRRMQKVWNSLAAERLTFVPDTTEEPAPGRLVMHGTAEGTFFGGPYKRRVSFTASRVDGEWRVAEMVLGEQLVAPPELRALEGEEP